MTGAPVTGALRERARRLLEATIGRRDPRESEVVGAPLVRVDGYAKVTGAAAYAADAQVPGCTHGFLVMSTIAQGRVTAIDTGAAEQAAGVLAVLTHLTMPRLALPGPRAGYFRSFLPLQDDVVHHPGQPVALVVAQTLEQAQDAASLVAVTYAAEVPQVVLEELLDQAIVPPAEMGPPNDLQRGDVAAGMAQADVRIEATYINPMHHHNAMEPSATTAAWDGDALTVHESAQGVSNTRATLAGALGVPIEGVRVLCPFVGGGFGAKGPVWPHTVLTAAAARVVGRPVKLVLSRAHQYTSSGHRAASTQTLALGATRDGRLTAVEHSITQQVSRTEGGAFSGLEPTQMTYAIPNLRTVTRTVALDLPAQSFVRSPEVVTNHGLESALDELSVELGIDPVELRRRNETAVDPMTGEPWGSRHLLECYDRGAELFGWSRRDPAPGSMRDGDELLGWGMATAAHTCFAFPASAAVTVAADGTALVQSGTQEIGTGTATVITQIAAQQLGLPMEAVRFELGDTALPPAGVSAGSSTVPSVGHAVAVRCAEARAAVVALAVADAAGPLGGLAPDRVVARDGELVSLDDPDRRILIRTVMLGHGQPVVVTGPPVQGVPGYSTGAAFVEVGVHPGIGRVRVRRVVGVYDPGTVLNEMTARSQAIGGVVWAIGYALMEETVVDAALGRIVNANLSDYLMAVNADVPDIRVEFVDLPDPTQGALGARGFGETPMTGMTAAIGNAVFHATGRRVRRVPITMDALL